MRGIWGFRWLKFFLNPFKEDEFKHISAKQEEQRREFLLDRLESAKFTEYSWIIVVAGVGFFTDSYCIYSLNMIVPMLGIVYWGGTTPHSYEIALSAVTLGGSVIGQVVFGLGADLWGRRKMYGLELIITIGATLGVVMCSNGIDGSVSIITWLLTWRFALGIGIGADYPLSAVICSEFAPTRLRGKMLAAVFFCQPLGQLAATIVALIAVSRQHGGISGFTFADCSDPNLASTCRGTLDSIWRWVIGVGVIPAFIALWFRLTIIESPRYTADVGEDSLKAASELNRYLPRNTKLPVASTDSGNETHQASTAIGLGLNDGLFQRGTNIQMAAFNVEGHSLSPKGEATSNVSARGGSEERDLPNHSDYTAPAEQSWEDFKDYFWHKGNLRTLLATSLCWFCVDLPFYGLGMSSPKIITAIWYGQTYQPGQVYDFLVANVWQSLIIVSLGAIVGCLVTFIAIDKLGRRNIQISGFLWLFILFIVIGATFKRLASIGGSSATIVLYILAQIFYNFGPNATTFIIPAEIFPTRYRGLCHGISAAFGKMGSVIAQLFLGYINYGNKINYLDIQDWLPYSLLIFSFFMLCGLVITWLWIPSNEHAPDGEVKTLEQWEVGRGDNGFSKTWLARIVAAVYRWLVKNWKVIYKFLSSISGDEADRQKLEAARAAEQEDDEDET